MAVTHILGFYDFYFSQSIRDDKNIIECGIGTNNLEYNSNMSSSGTPGASLIVLKDYFTEADIYGIDIDEFVLFQENRIRTIQVDQTDPSSILFFKQKINNVKFELVIDDGFHTFDSAITLFENLQSCLGKNFKYIIEDVYPIDISKCIEYFSKKKYAIQVIELFRDKKLHNKMGDNNMILY